MMRKPLTATLSPGSTRGLCVCLLTDHPRVAAALETELRPAGIHVLAGAPGEPWPEVARRTLLAYGGVDQIVTVEAWHASVRMNAEAPLAALAAAWRTLTGLNEVPTAVRLLYGVPPEAVPTPADCAAIWIEGTPDTAELARPLAGALQLLAREPDRWRGSTLRKRRARDSGVGPVDRPNGADDIEMTVVT